MTNDRVLTRPLPRLLAPPAAEFFFAPSLVDCVMLELPALAPSWDHHPDLANARIDALECMVGALVCRLVKAFCKIDKLAYGLPDAIRGSPALASVALATDTALKQANAKIENCFDIQKKTSNCCTAQLVSHTRLQEQINTVQELFPKLFRVLRACGRSPSAAADVGDVAGAHSMVSERMAFTPDDIVEEHLAGDYVLDPVSETTKHGPSSEPGPFFAA